MVSTAAEAEGELRTFNDVLSVATMPATELYSAAEALNDVINTLSITKQRIIDIIFFKMSPLFVIPLYHVYRS